MYNMDCAICLDALESKSSCTCAFKCDHMFHKNCIAKWHGTCPVCRAPRCPFAQFKTEDKHICDHFGISSGDVLYITFHSVEIELRGTFKYIHRYGNNDTHNIYLHLQDVQLINENKETSQSQYHFLQEVVGSASVHRSISI